ncbi:hypothetical protein PNIG_a0394 [Pseudoalteromonas nigrifaciens]|uniref:Transposase putative helix-turn-helix domain-containing protein n=1 Tax=Pseudoalteromonas nigrifaciens TaxID=28109 RepID=A0AAC9XW57_9GAMM|nr:hypothetical protein PNIG_a0394 [Pseudoalteromonas nigrifaciens]MBH0093448.1 helix-turn-helix domain-containing protein [Pseudoalteromonas sp. SCQQ13]
MVIRKAYKFRLKTTPDINAKMVQYAGNCRFLWNKALAINLFKLQNKQKICYYQELDFFSKLWKKKRGVWLFNTIARTNYPTNIKTA